MVVHRLRGGLTGNLSLAALRRKSSNTLSAVQDTFLSTKAVFENHRVVFTVGTSIASVLTAWGGYTIRHLHESNVEKRLQAIEESLKSNYEVEHEEIKKIVSSGNVSIPACFATAWTTLVLGYAMGWRGGVWYTNRRIQREQLKRMGQIKPRRWQFPTAAKPLIKLKPFLKFRGGSRIKSVESPPVSCSGSVPISDKIVS
ncbi:hypothetical protein LUZ60_002235 [Juncus effusus]|nr:hypothetical protein LUZ60_002235 [Juncus effusus]